jgi:fumarylacetoacetase
VIRPPEGFGPENLPFGVIAPRDGAPRVAVRLGDEAIDLDALGSDVTGLPEDVVRAASLNPLLALGPDAWREVRLRLQQAVTDSPRDRLAAARHPLDAVSVLMPIEVGDFVDFYASLHHATNLGRILRPDSAPLLPNWRHLPVSYTGRAGTVRASGAPVARPHGLRPGPEGPIFGPSTQLDFELEVGFVVGAPGTRIPADDADRHVFGAVLLNDWSARDIQAYEYQPLGPHLGKSFATTISPWVVTIDALRPFLVPPPPQDPEPAGYLRAERPWGLDLELRVALNDTEICATNFAGLYWTFAQQLAHMTVNGATTRPGDLFGSGTVSGPGPHERGSLMELTRRGAEPIALDDGARRGFLEDGDVVTITGWCGGAVRPAIGLGECTGRVVAGPDPAAQGEPAT